GRGLSPYSCDGKRAGPHRAGEGRLLCLEADGRKAGAGSVKLPKLLKQSRFFEIEFTFNLAQEFVIDTTLITKFDRRASLDFQEVARKINVTAIVRGSVAIRPVSIAFNN